MTEVLSIVCTKSPVEKMLQYRIGTIHPVVESGLPVLLCTGVSLVEPGLPVVYCYVQVCRWLSLGYL